MRVNVVCGINLFTFHTYRFLHIVLLVSSFALNRQIFFGWEGNACYEILSLVIRKMISTWMVIFKPIQICFFYVNPTYIQHFMAHPVKMLSLLLLISSHHGSKKGVKNGSKTTFANNVTLLWLYIALEIRCIYMCWVLMRRADAVEWYWALQSNFHVHIIRFIARLFNFVIIINDDNHFVRLALF